MPPKHLFCAQCGLEVHYIRRALPKQEMIVDIIEPHVCSDEVALPAGLIEKDFEIVPVKKEKPIDLAAKFDSFKMVKKLNDLSPKPETVPFEGIGDKREGKDLREEKVTSTAPSGILDQVKEAMPSAAVPASRPSEEEIDEADLNPKED